MKSVGLRIGLTKHIAENIWLYVISAACMVVGIIIGIYTVKYLGKFSQSDLQSYLNSFSQNFNIGKVSYKELFFESIKNNIPFILFMWFLGLTMIGIPLVLIVDLVKGFTLGFSISFIISNMGSKGLGIIFLGLIPQNLFYIPCYIVASVLAIEFSLTIITDRLNKRWANNLWGSVLSYSCLYLFIMVIMVAGFFVEAYLTPNLVKLVVMNNWSMLA